MVKEEIYFMLDDLSFMRLFCRTHVLSMRNECYDHYIHPGRINEHQLSSPNGSPSTCAQARYEYELNYNLCIIYLKSCLTCRVPTLDLSGRELII